MKWSEALRVIEDILERGEEGGGLAVTDDECNIDLVLEDPEITEALQAAREALAIQVDSERKRAREATQAKQ